MGVPSLNDLAVDGTLNTNKQTNKARGAIVWAGWRSVVDGSPLFSQLL